MTFYAPRFFGSLVVALSVVILGLVARAEGPAPTPGQQQLRTADGEMFVGEVISQNAEVIRFRSVLAGELTVPARGVMLSRRDPATAELAAQTPGWVKITTALDLAAGGGAPSLPPHPSRRWPLPSARPGNSGLKAACRTRMRRWARVIFTRWAR